MRSKLLLALAVTAVGALAAASARAQVPPFKGNDTGGIIAWSPETHRLRRQLAAQHCSLYDKTYQITSVRARYGDYIGFRCYWPRGTGSMTLRRAY
jgi:hypothetical protein